MHGGSGQVLEAAFPEFARRSMVVFDMVRLNVGGKNFYTTKATLRATPDNMLCALVADNMSAATDQFGSIFIDRDPKHFRHVLNYLRGVLEPPAGADAKRQLALEFEYYALPSAAAAELRELAEEERLRAIPQPGPPGMRGAPGSVTVSNVAARAELLDSAKPVITLSGFLALALAILLVVRREGT
ncbi:BTB/POZ domain-containing protein [uncultured virus]|nr:BTB/POZ domain-containing protein [uncultured virus]